MNVNGYAVVTGAASGIGRTCAIAYAAEGAAGVLFADINADAAQRAADDSKHVATNPDYKTIAMSVNVTSEAEVQAMVDRAVKEWGRVDYGILSAGVGVEQPADIPETPIAEFNKFYQVNVLGTLLCVRSLSAQMRKQDPLSLAPHPSSPSSASVKSLDSNTTQSSATAEGLATTAPRSRGSIITLGSCNSYVATPQITQYTTSKHAVLGLTRNAALDNASHGVRVNCVCPSWVETPMIERAVAGDPALGQIMKRVVPMGRIARPEEVADAVLWLGGGRSSFVTGAGLVVDGGATLMMQTS